MYASDESYWDEYDIQPFRNYLFETQRASAEFFNIIKDLGYDDNNCAINNYDNTIEFQGDCIAYLLLMVGYWIEDWEQMIEEYQLFTMLFNDLNSAKAEGAIWSRPVLDSMWRHLKPRTTSLGEPAIT
jgi:hypothetical protein